MTYIFTIPHIMHKEDQKELVEELAVGIRKGLLAYPSTHVRLVAIISDSGDVTPFYFEEKSNETSKN